MRLSKKLVTAVAIVGAIAVLSPGSAHAATGAGVTGVVGSGTISPGLTPTTGVMQTVSFTGTAAGVAATTGPSDAGALTCSFTGGSSSPETSFEGAGTVTGTCTGTGAAGNFVSVTCTFNYLRTGSLVTIMGNCSASVGTTPFAGPAAGVFVFAPTTATPTTSYALAGATVGVSP